MTRPFSSEQIGQYLAGELPPEVAEQVRAYLDANESRRGFVEGISASIRGEAAGPRPTGLETRDAMLAKIAEADASADATDRPGTSLPHRHISGTTRGPLMPTMPRGSARTWLSRPVVIAGIAVVAVIMTLADIVGRSIRQGEPPAPADRQYATKAGQFATVTLPDGTNITLAPTSQLSVSHDFPAVRRVALRGEAYFDVAHATGAPFIVQTDVAETTVLGTAFNVRARAGDAHVRVAVIHGKVRTRGGSSAVTLAAGDVADVTDSSARLVTDVPATQYASWTTGHLTFTNAPVSDVLATLAQWYDIDFRMTDSSLQAQHVTGVFDARSRANALNALKGVLDASLTFEQTDHRLVVVIRSWARPAARSVPTREHDHLSSSATEVGR